jgi:hypothetical protein
MPKSEMLQRAIRTPIVLYEKPVEEPFKPEPPTFFSTKNAQQLEELMPLPPEIPARVRITPTLTQEVKDRGYRNIEIDLSTARTNEALGIRRLGIVADTMTIIRADSAFTYRLNSASNDETPAEKGLIEDQFEIEEVYVTNEALSGKAIIRVIWNPRLVRPE